ncbi:family 43 glycosylhydrolase [Novosphingobium sp. MMS21-SN21R]|uniref:family 43 glycosylhydrolase n=1 Tax=Novosphingobium sp. MMS21-SN21R TaxID=2969298 RepID=UPI002887CC8C|nr:family 43 glycosylhydrolase [Novosphingobium sp. MMS21-SN21R]MDT0510098.1 family 43 glycosylhydrolase [Novosphingobium sp. MMS21-SN21R]MDT0510271.1 family 43 glycosylhydrolase [Novosphingobium sp. MMS21-SN21R]
MSIPESTRREVLSLAMAGAAATSLPIGNGAALAKGAPDRVTPKRAFPWKRGIEGQRRADLGNGTYLNPVLAGDHPDPSVLHDGDQYYKVSSSFEYYPGLLIWQSADLVNWTPIGPALQRPVGSVFAPDLVKHDGRYFIYFPALNIPIAASSPPPGPRRPTISVMVVHADRIEGPWSEPADMDIFDGIDPGHAVGEDGKRYLFLNGGNRVPISDDGLSRAGPTQKVYEGWKIPADWVIEGFELEGPKMLRRGEWFYMFAAQGGTGGPPTGHMVIVARSRSIHGPWENCPHNPIVRTVDPAEPWWSRGHATPILGPGGDWWLVYHGYENGFRTLGRQLLLEPFTWTADGWPCAMGGDLSRPLRKPMSGASRPHGTALSDDFQISAFGTRLQFFGPGADYASRAVLTDGTLVLQGLGSGPADAAPLVLNAGERRYEVEVELELTGDAIGGLLLFYNSKLFCGLGADENRLHQYKTGVEPFYPPAGPSMGRKMHFRVVNDENVASFYQGRDGQTWQLVRSYEVSGYNHNIGDGFLSLRPAIFAAREGSVSFRRLQYRSL